MWSSRNKALIKVCYCLSTEIYWVDQSHRWRDGALFVYFLKLSIQFLVDLIVQSCFHVLFSDSWKFPDFIERFEEGVSNPKGEISSRSTSGPVVMSALKRQCLGNRILCIVYFNYEWSSFTEKDCIASHSIVLNAFSR